MDSNVSKNTFYYKLLKLAINPGDLAIKKLLKQHISTKIKLYQNYIDLKVEFNLIEDLIADKLILCNFKQSYPDYIVYRCAIAFPLANKWCLQPLTVAQNLSEFLLIPNVTSTTKPILRFIVQVVSPGWLDFYMSDRALAVWLEEVIRWVGQVQESRPAKEQGRRELGKQGSFFEIQYAHARCCSLLRLGHQEKLIKIKQQYSGWEIIEPCTISWIDAQGTFWLIHPTEKHLLIQLLIIVENLSTNSENVNWAKLAQSLSDVFLDFWAECRILGLVKQKTPELAQARLGLVALVQYFLFKILKNKLSVRPLTEI